MIISKPPKLPGPSGISKYIQTDLYSWLQSLVSGINGRLNFDDNFQSFISEDIEISAGETAIISNELNVIPNERYIVRQIGNGIISDGEWDIDSLRLVNNGAVSVTISVRFFHIYQPTQ